MTRHRTVISLAATLLLTAAGCAAEPGDASTSAQDTPPLDLDIEALRAAVGDEGKEDGGEWKVTVPQNDLDVRVEGFRIVPPMGLGSWAAFTSAPEGAAVMGDLVVQEDEVGPVQRVLLEQGLTVTALHKHFLREEPRVAGGLRAALDRTGTPRSEDR